MDITSALFDKKGISASFDKKGLSALFDKREYPPHSIKMEYSSYSAIVYKKKSQGLRIQCILNP